MEMVLLTALGVGGATIIGAIIGFFFKKPSHKFNDIILSFAAGVMLAAAVIGLIMPSLESENKTLLGRIELVEMKLMYTEKLLSVYEKFENKK